MQFDLFPDDEISFQEVDINDLTVDEAVLLDMTVFINVKKFNMMSLGSNGAQFIIKRLSLEPVLDFYHSMNSASDLPYHNSYHMECMVLNCFEGAFYLPQSIPVTRGLITAAIMHDFAHSGGTLSDESNVRLAIESLEVMARYIESRGCFLTKEELSVARGCIEVTKYPYDRNPSSTAEAIIRDADLMQIYETCDHKLRKQFLGLKSEIERQYGKPLSASEFALKNKEFLDKVRWSTIWGIDKANYLGWELLKRRMVDVVSA